MGRSILERLAKGQGIKAICRQLKVGRERVRDVRDRGIALGYLDASGAHSGGTPIPLAPLAVFPDAIDARWTKSSEPDQALLKHLAWIRERLEAGWRSVTVFEELPCPGIARSSFYRFLERHGLRDLARGARPATLTPPIVHQPGEALLVDWGKLRDVVDPESGTRRTLWAFVGVMGFSRYLMVRLVWTNSVAVTFDAIESMLRELGGGPRRVTSDNPKCFSLKADQHDPLLNPAFARFAAHYDFVPECLPARDPEKKGKVERPMPFVRRLFEAYSKDFQGIEHAQTYLNRKIVMANERRHGTTGLKPVEVYHAEELQHMSALPPLAHEREEVAYPTVRKDGFVRFDGKYYAVADAFIGLEAVVLATAKRVSIFVTNQLAETYERLVSRHQTHAIAEHLKKPWQKIEESNAHYLRMAEKVGPDCLSMVRALLQKGDGFVDTRIVWGLLSLDKKGYPREKINEACRTAFQLGRLSSRFVESLIRLTLAPAPGASHGNRAQPAPLRGAPAQPEVPANPAAAPNPCASPPTAAAAPAQTEFKFVRPMSVYQNHVMSRTTPDLTPQPAPPPRRTATSTR